MGRHEINTRYISLSEISSGQNETFRRVMRVAHLLYILLGVFALSACNDPDAHTELEDAPPLGDTLQAEQIEIETKLWNPRAIEVVADDYLVVVDDATSGIFKVFRLPDLEFLYAWGNRGEGPGELEVVPSSHTINIVDDTLVIASSQAPELSRLEYYHVTDTAITLERTAPLSYDGQRHPLNNVHRINDTLYFAK